jgi:hypothetical protein
LLLIYFIEYKSIPFDAHTTDFHSTLFKFASTLPISSLPLLLKTLHKELMSDDPIKPWIQRNAKTSLATLVSDIYRIRVVNWTPGDLASALDSIEERFELACGEGVWEMMVEVGVQGLIKECVRELSELGLVHVYVGEGANEVMMLAKAVGVFRQFVVVGSELSTKEVFDAVLSAVKSGSNNIDFIVPAFKESYGSFVKRVWAARSDEGFCCVGDVVRVGLDKGGEEESWVGFERVIDGGDGEWREAWKGLVGVRRRVI